jgi:hypothetical protein
MEDKISKAGKEKYKKTREILKKTPGSERYSKLVDLGFEYIEEEDDGIEKQEEDNAKPLNNRQKILVKYFEGKSRLSSDIIEQFILEIEGEDANYPLLRKYFKQGYKSILALLKQALVIYPLRVSLINAFVFLSEHNNVFSELISAYTNACKREESISSFEDLVRGFYMNASKHDYDVFLSLREICKNNQQKLEIISKVEKYFQVEYDLKPNFH